MERSIDREQPVILVVDDDEPTRRLFAAALGRAGFATLLAADGRDALDIVSDESVATVLLDGRMPGMSGLEVLAELRALPGGATLPVIFVSGQDELDDRIRGLEAGATDYLTKPVELDELVARVRAQLRTHATWAHLVDDLERRLDAVLLLRRIRRSETAELTAIQLCAELVDLDGIDGAAVLAVWGPRAVVPLAVRGVLEAELVAGAPLGEAAAAQLSNRLRSGPWVQHTRPDAGLRDPDSFSFSTSYHLAVAPFHGEEGLLGALLLVGGSDAGERSAMLSAAIDFAAVVGALITPDLARQQTSHQARATLRAIIDTGAFASYFQPVVDLTTDEVVGYEGLTRWSDGTRPDVRFAEASALGIGVEVEQATLQALVEAAAPLDAMCWLGLNVSAELVQSGSLDDLVANQDRPIVLELTEHEPVEDYGSVERAVRSMSGVRLAVDDAGAGYASMRHILSLRPDFVKLDITWVRDVASDQARQALIAGMVGLAAELGSFLVAEGIETEAERATLRGLGVAFGQGYLLGRPAPADAWS